MQHAYSVKPYKKEQPFSYAPGTFASVELLKAAPELARSVYLSEHFRGGERLLSLCKEHGVPVCRDEKIFRRLGFSEGIFAAAMFEKSDEGLTEDAPHVVLANPDDMGNLGTIARTMAGLGFHDLAVVTPAADLFHPKCVRASMGAHFHLRHAFFPSLRAYRARYPARPMLLFEAGGVPPDPCFGKGAPPFSLVFGNEASGFSRVAGGVPENARRVGLEQSGAIDSFSLPVAVALGLYRCSM